METIGVRHAFPSWSIAVPISFAETFVVEDGYWHGYDAHRSVSLSSVLLSDDAGPVPARMILDQFSPMLRGKRIPELPSGLTGWAVGVEAVKPVRASRALSGVLVADGRVLVVTITSDDLTWARGVWSSIRYHAAEPPPPRHLAPSQAHA